MSSSVKKTLKLVCDHNTKIVDPKMQFSINFKQLVGRTIGDKYTKMIIYLK